MKAVMYGAGNIGRGFIGALLAQSGYSVTFVDVAQPVVAALNERRGYPVRIIDGAGHEDVQISGVDAVDGRDADAVAEAIAECDIMATAVGANILKFIAPNITEGVRRRLERCAPPLNILICENLMDANLVLRELIKADLTDAEVAQFDANVGLVEASIGRMVPVQTPEMQDGDSLRVCVERYGFLPVDGGAFLGERPNIERMIFCSPFDFYIKRKLFLHNMGHAVCAYLGLYSGLEFIWQAVGNAEIQLIARGAMEESLRALCMEFDAPPLELLAHVDDLLARFGNRALGDTCARVSNDPVRKLAPQDRLIGAALLCERHGIAPAHIAAGAAAAVHMYLAGRGDPQTEDRAVAALAELSGLDEDGALARLILDQHALLARGAGLSELRAHAQAEQARTAGEII